MPRQQPPPDDPCARTADLRAIGAAWDSAHGPTDAGTGIGRGATGSWADLLVREDVADVRGIHSHVDRCRVAASFANTLMTLPEPEGRFRGRFTPRPAGGRTARRKK